MRQSADPFSFTTLNSWIVQLGSSHTCYHDALCHRRCLCNVWPSKKWVDRDCAHPISTPVISHESTCWEWLSSSKAATNCPPSRARRWRCNGDGTAGRQLQSTNDVLKFRYVHAQLQELYVSSCKCLRYNQPCGHSSCSMSGGNKFLISKLTVQVTSWLIHQRLQLPCGSE